MNAKAHVKVCYNMLMRILDKVKRKKKLIILTKEIFWMIRGILSIKFARNMNTFSLLARKIFER